MKYIIIKICLLFDIVYFIPKILTLNNDLLTGNATIDKQHKYLIDTINLYEYAISINNIEIIKIAKARCVDYIYFHFLEEEQLMFKYNLDRTILSPHILAHRTFTTKIINFNGNDVELLSFLKNWVINHIGVMDKYMVGELKGV